MITKVFLNQAAKEKKQNAVMHVFGILNKLCQELSFKCFFYNVNNEARKLECIKINPQGSYKISILLTNIGLYALYDRCVAIDRYPYLLDTFPAINRLVFLPKWVKSSENSSYTLSPQFRQTFSKHRAKRKDMRKLALICKLFEGLILTKDFLSKRNKQKMQPKLYFRNFLATINKAILMGDEIGDLLVMFNKLDTLAINEYEKHPETSKVRVSEKVVIHTQALPKITIVKSQALSNAIALNQHAYSDPEHYERSSKSKTMQILEHQASTCKFTPQQSLFHTMPNFKEQQRTSAKSLGVSLIKEISDTEARNLGSTEKIVLKKLGLAPTTCRSVGQPISSTQKQATKPIFSDKDCVFCEKGFQLIKPVVLQCRHLAHPRCLKK